MKRNSACRVHSDLGNLSLSQLKPGQRVTVTQAGLALVTELGETYLSRPCRVWADSSELHIILLHA